MRNLIVVEDNGQEILYQRVDRRNKPTHRSPAHKTPPRTRESPLQKRSARPSVAQARGSPPHTRQRRQRRQNRQQTNQSAVEELPPVKVTVENLTTEKIKQIQQSRM